MPARAASFDRQGPCGDGARSRRGAAPWPLLPSDALPLRLEGVFVGSGELSLLVEVDGAVHIDFTWARIER